MNQQPSLVSIKSKNSHPYKAISTEHRPDLSQISPKSQLGKLTFEDQPSDHDSLPVFHPPATRQNRRRACLKLNYDEYDPAEKEDSLVSIPNKVHPKFLELREQLKQKKRTFIKMKKPDKLFGFNTARDSCGGLSFNNYSQAPTSRQGNRESIGVEEHIKYFKEAFQRQKEIIKQKKMKKRIEMQIGNQMFMKTKPQQQAKLSLILQKKDKEPENVIIPVKKKKNKFLTHLNNQTP